MTCDVDNVDNLTAVFVRVIILYMAKKKSSSKRRQPKIYLDCAATTPVDQKVLKAMQPYFSDKFGNAGSIHSFGQEAQIAIDEARQKTADFLGCSSQEIIFTGSATEADNLAILGLIQALKKRKREGEKIHIISSFIEHKAVLSPLGWLEEAFGKGGGLEKEKDVKVAYLPVSPEGIIDIESLEKEIIPETDLVSVMYANNEMGAIQPIKKIGALIEKINKDKEHPIFFHTDAVQAANYLDCEVNNLKVDLMTLSGHKIYGPKGVGALYVRKGVPLAPLIYGGDQEWGLRAGTENAAAIVGFGEAIAAIAAASRRLSAISRIEKLRNKLIDGILYKIPDSKLNGPLPGKDRLPNNANISFQGIEGESIVISLDMEGVAVSTGSACTSKALKPSHVLVAMGLAEEWTHSSIRFSLGKYTTAKEINYVIRILPSIVKRLRSISGR